MKRSLDVAAIVSTHCCYWHSRPCHCAAWSRGLSLACATHRRPGVATVAVGQGLKRDEIRLGRDAGPSRAPHASGASASRGPFYFAWGCFRVFVSGRLRHTSEGYPHCVRGQPVPRWCPRDRRALPAKQTSARGQKTAVKSRSSRFWWQPAARLAWFWALVFRPNRRKTRGFPS